MYAFLKCSIWKNDTFDRCDIHVKDSQNRWRNIPITERVVLEVTPETLLKEPQAIRVATLGEVYDGLQDIVVSGMRLTVEAKRLRYVKKPEAGPTPRYRWVVCQIVDSMVKIEEYWYALPQDAETRTSLRHLHYIKLPELLGKTPLDKVALSLNGESVLVSEAYTLPI